MIYSWQYAGLPKTLRLPRRLPPIKFGETERWPDEQGVPGNISPELRTEPTASRNELLLEYFKKNSRSRIIRE
jgi:hypothetical protein